MHSGFTAIEVTVALTVIGILVGVAVPRFAALRDRALVRGAANDIASALAATRHAAVVRASRAALRLDTLSATILVQSPRALLLDTLLVRPLAAVHPGVALEATRDSIAYAPTGLGYGAANATIVVRLRQARETLWVSRLGRVRRQ